MLKFTASPQGEKLSDDFIVELNEEVTFNPYEARVSAMPYNTTWPGMQRPIDQTEFASFFSFKMDEEIRVHLKSKKEFSEVEIRPLSKNIKARIDGNDIYFTIKEVGQYTVELDGFHNALHIFADPICDFGVDKNDECVIYFAPGVHHAGVIEVTSNQTVFIDSGAVVYGSVVGMHAENVRVVGYGVLDGSEEQRYDDTLLLPSSYYSKKYNNMDISQDEQLLKDFLINEKTLHGCIRFYSCQNIEISGVVCRDAASYTVIPAACNNVTIDNIKLIGMWRYNSDGIDLFNCSNSVIKNCFLRNFDDCVVLKGFKGWDTHNMENILVKNCVIWCDWGRALEIGAETSANEYRNIIFEDCDIIHGAYIMLDIQNLGRAEVHHILFKNIRCEFTKYQLSCEFQCDMSAPYTNPTKNEQPLLLFASSYEKDLFSDDGIIGKIHDISFKDIFVYCDEGITMPKSMFRGVDAEHMAADIIIDGLYMNGKKIDAFEKANIDCNQYTKNVIIK